MAPPEHFYKLGVFSRHQIMIGLALKTDMAGKPDTPVTWGLGGTGYAAGLDPVAERHDEFESLSPHQGLL